MMCPPRKARAQRKGRGKAKARCPITTMTSRVVGSRLELTKSDLGLVLESGDLTEDENLESDMESFLGNVPPGIVKEGGCLISSSIELFVEILVVDGSGDTIRSSVTV